MRSKLNRFTRRLRVFAVHVPHLAERLEPRTMLSTYVVTNNNDSGLGSLRGDILLANNSPGADIITFAPGLQGTIVLTTGLLDISDNLTIEGPGAGALTVSGNHQSSVFEICDPTKYINNQPSATISGLAINNGSASTGVQFGGGIYDVGTLLVANCTFDNNSAPASGGAIGILYGGATIINCEFSNDSAKNGGAIASDQGSALSVSGCTFAHNIATSGGGAIEGGPFGGDLLTNSVFSDDQARDGGAIYENGNIEKAMFDHLTIQGCSAEIGGAMDIRNAIVILSNSNITGNTASSKFSFPEGGGIYGGNLTVTNTTFSNNDAPLGGGGAILDQDGPLSVVASTFYSNTADEGGALLIAPFDLYNSIANCTFYGNSAYEAGAVYDEGSNPTAHAYLFITSTTIVGNSATYMGGGLYGYGQAPAASSVDDTIVAGNQAQEFPNTADISGTTSGSNDLIGTLGSGGLMNGVNGNIVGVSDPKLGPLADNGGPTQTMALLPGSPAIDAGSNVLAVDENESPLITDQRGLPRISNGTVDIGAYELQQTLELLGTTIGDGTPQRSEVRSLTFRFNQPVTLSAGAVTLALLNSGGSGKNDGSAPTDVSAALGQPTTSDGGFTWVFTFPSSDSRTVDPTGSLLDGIYTATLHATAIGGSTDPLVGGDQTITFHRLFGDINGDKTVNNLDYFKFNKAFNSKTGDATYNADFDFNGDGVINNTDYFQFNKNFAKTFIY